MANEIAELAIAKYIDEDTALDAGSVPVLRRRLVG